MKNIFNSASKIVLILAALTAFSGFLIGKLNENSFMVLVGSIFTFYFTRKGENATEGK